MAGQPQGKKEATIDCMEVLDMLWLCVIPGSQIRNYYRNGIHDDCGRYSSDLYSCLQAKLSPDQEKIKATDAALSFKHIVSKEGSPTKDMWEFKDKPSW